MICWGDLAVFGTEWHYFPRGRASCECGKLTAGVLKDDGRLRGTNPDGIIFTD